MRYGIRGLTQMVWSWKGHSPASGDVYVFFSKDRRTMKALKWDGDGFLMAAAEDVEHGVHDGVEHAHAETADERAEQVDEEVEAYVEFFHDSHAVFFDGRRHGEHACVDSHRA